MCRQSPKQLLCLAGLLIGILPTILAATHLLQYLHCTAKLSFRQRIVPPKIDTFSVSDGMAAAEGKLFISPIDGTVVCFAEK